MAEPSGSTEFAADIGNRVYWLAVLVGLAVGPIAAGFHIVVDLITAVRGGLVSGAFDDHPALLAVASWLGPTMPWLPDATAHWVSRPCLPASQSASRVSLPAL